MISNFQTGGIRKKDDVYNSYDVLNLSEKLRREKAKMNDPYENVATIREDVIIKVNHDKFLKNFNIIDDGNDEAYFEIELTDDFRESVPFNKESGVLNKLLEYTGGKEYNYITEVRISEI